MNNRELQEQLEKLIDAHGVPTLLSALSQVAYDKAEHVQCNWQDTALAAKWAKTGYKLAKVAASV